MTSRPARLSAPAVSVPSGAGQDGIVDLPSGKIAAIATYLDLRSPGAGPPSPSAEARAWFDPIGAELGRYRALYKAVGEQWLWFSRARMSDAKLRTILVDPDVVALAFRRGGRDLGLVELDFRQAGQCELSFLGLVQDAIGCGYGHVMIAEAVRRAFARPIERLWLHTCTLDHPAALRFYMAAGFKPYRRAVEIAQDPRLTGDLAPDAAPALPIV